MVEYWNDYCCEYVGHRYLYMSKLFFHTFCVGVLGIPFAIAQLGWMKGMISLILLAVGAVYSGNVLYKLQRKVPEARAMSDLGLKAMGTFGQTVVMAVAYLYMFGVSVGFLWFVKRMYLKRDIDYTAVDGDVGDAADCIWT